MSEKIDDIISLREYAILNIMYNDSDSHKEPIAIPRIQSKMKDIYPNLNDLPRSYAGYFLNKLADNGCVIKNEITKKTIKYSLTDKGIEFYLTLKKQIDEFASNSVINESYKLSMQNIYNKMEEIPLKDLEDCACELAIELARKHSCIQISVHFAEREYEEMQKNQENLGSQK